jgi:uncharacterized repeat protein (TIGR02543 family)
VFYGTVSALNPPGPVEGETVQAFVDGEWRVDSLDPTDAQGNYYLQVPGPTGGTVTFKVAGVAADQTGVWQGGETTKLDLTIPALQGPGYNLSMAVSPAGTGSATDVTNSTLYAAGVAVSIQAVAAEGYHFVSWTAPAGGFTNPSSATTTFTMPAQDVTVTANFEVGGAYTLAMAASPIMGGTAYDVSGESPYNEGGVVSIQAIAASGYQFAGWAAPAGSFANAYAAATTFTMPGQDVTVTATFQVTQTSSGCFIATAAYGSPAAGQIDVLREFRDGALLESAAGSQFVDLYYRLSPPIADFISGDSFVRTVIRELLVDPLVWMVEAIGDIWRN